MADFFSANNVNTYLRKYVKFAHERTEQSDVVNECRKDNMRFCIPFAIAIFDLQHLGPSKAKTSCLKAVHIYQKWLRRRFLLKNRRYGRSGRTKQRRRVRPDIELKVLVAVLAKNHLAHVYSLISANKMRQKLLFHCLREGHFKVTAHQRFTFRDGLFSMILNNLGNSLLNSNFVKQASEVFEMTLTVKKRVYTTDSADYANTQQNLALTKGRLKKLKEMISLLQSAQAILEKHTHKLDSRLLLCRYNLAQAYGANGETKAMFDELNQLKEPMSIAFGPKHPYVSQLLTMLEQQPSATSNGTPSSVRRNSTRETTRA